MDQHRLEREIRAMLRRARRPEDLEEIPLVRDLCSALGISNASLMLRELVEAAFSDVPAEIKLRTLVFDCDLNGTTTQEGAARSLNVSRRQFHRMRTQAVRIIAKQVRRILVDTTEDLPRDEIEQLARSLAASRPDAASKIFSLATSSGVGTRLQELRARLDAGECLDERTAASFPLATRATALALVAQSRFLRGESAASIDPVLREIEKLTSQSGRGYDELTRFELEYLNFLRARSRSDGIAMRSSARSLERLAGERKPLQRRAITASAEAALRCGETEEARRLGVLLQGHSSTAQDVRYLANASLLNAQIHFIEGDYLKAEVGARASRLALAQHFPDALRAEILVGRIAIASDAAWEPSDLLAHGTGEPLEHLGLANVYARYLLRHHEIDRARDLARTTHERANSYGYRGVAVYALVTLGAIEDAIGNQVPSQRHYERALIELADVFDALACSDLFAIPGLPERNFGPFPSVDATIEPLLERMRRVIPDLLFATTTIDAWRGFFRALLDDGLAHELESIAADPSIRRTVIRHGASIADALTFFATPVLPRRRRAAFVARVRETLRAIYDDPASNVPNMARARSGPGQRLEA